MKNVIVTDRLSLNVLNEDSSNLKLQRISNNDAKLLLGNGFTSIVQTKKTSVLFSELLEQEVEIAYNSATFMFDSDTQILLVGQYTDLKTIQWWSICES